MEGGTIEHAVLQYNKALILVRLRQSNKAIDILQGLFAVDSALDKNLSIQVCSLLAELYLTTYQTHRAKGLLLHMENKFFEGNIHSSGDKDKNSSKDFFHDAVLKDRMHQFRAWLYLLNGATKLCKKEIKVLTTSAGYTTSAVYLKANLEYQRGNYRKAMKVLASAPKTPILTDAGECLPSFYYNNLGCIHSQMGKHCLSSHYFKKALEENDTAVNDFPPQDKATPLSGRPLHVLGVNCRHILLYNLGLQQLFLGKPLLAFESLLEAVQVYHSNPRLWLRLAEACIATHCVNEKERVKQQHWKSQTVQVVVGHGTYQKIILVPTQTMPPGSHGSVTQSAAMPTPSLGFATICLKNALFLLPSMSTILNSVDTMPQGGGNSDDNGSDGNSTEQISVCALPGPSISGREILSLRLSVLVCSAYVALSLGDNVMALSYAKEVLNCPTLPGALKFLANLYAAEATIHLGLLQEAANFLNPDDIMDISLSVGSTATGKVELQSESPREYGNFPTSVQTAKGLAYLNLASLYCIRREIDRARKALLQVATLFASTKLPPQAILLSAYIELQSGNIHTALQIIKHHQLLTVSRVGEKKRRGK
jgi:CCR4-NOT transcription complex subunit 10